MPVRPLHCLLFFGLLAFWLTSAPAAAQYPLPSPTPLPDGTTLRPPPLGPGLQTGLKRVTLRKLPEPVPGRPSNSFVDLTVQEATQPDPLLAVVDPRRYRLAAGDQLEVIIVSAEQFLNPERLDQVFKRRRTVGPDGTVSVGPAVKVRVDGMRLDEAERAIQRGLARYLRNFQVTASLAYVRRFPVQITGEVRRPGTYHVSGVTGVAQAVLEAGGLTEEGSMRRVQVLNQGTSRPVAQLDFLKWQQLGEQSQNPYLSSHQLIVVPAHEREVELSGQVVLPGIYEILPGETLRSLTQLSGGFTSYADLGRVQVGRIEPDGQRQSHILNLSDPNSMDWNFRLETGDQIQVYDLTLAQARVVVLGELVGRDFFPITYNQATGYQEIQRRGVYKSQKGETLRDLVRALGGPTAKADMDHAWVERVGPNGELLKIPFSMRAVLTDEQSAAANLALHDGDTVVVPGVPDTVFVAGHVVRPGPVPYTPGWSLRDYVAFVGGTTDAAHTKHTRLVHPVPGEPPVVYEFNLLDVMEEGAEPAVEIRPGDIIWVPLYAPVYRDVVQFLPSLLLVPQLFR